MKKTAKPVQSKKYFHEVIEEEQKILDIGLKMSRQHKKERTESEKLQDELYVYNKMAINNHNKTI